MHVSHLVRLLTIVSFYSFVVCLPGQQNTGRIVGIISDASSSVISAASVIAKHTATGLTSTTRSNEVGAYAFQSLPIGEYTIEVTAAGFQKASRAGIQIVASKELAADFSMVVGTIAQITTVTADRQTVDSVSNATGTTRGREEISELPLSMRGTNRSSFGYLRNFSGVSYNLASSDTATRRWGL